MASLGSLQNILGGEKCHPHPSGPRGDHFRIGGGSFTVLLGLMFCSCLFCYFTHLRLLLAVICIL